MKQYSVKSIARLSGVSIRTLHYYDEINLLNPMLRTSKGYRMYGENELLKLQQILFYKELEIPLDKIKIILDDPDFNVTDTLLKHKETLMHKADRIKELVNTIDKTILKLNGQMMMTDEELYAGFSPEQVEKYRNEIETRYGKETIIRSEQSLRQLSKSAFEELKTEAGKIYASLIDHRMENPESETVQIFIANHYRMIRAF